MHRIQVGHQGIWVQDLFYIAPEVMCRLNHGVAVDYFALGIIVYECMMGRVRLNNEVIETLPRIQ